MDLFGTLVNGILYKKDNDRYYVKKGLFTKQKCIIESYVKGVPVTWIDEKAFKNSKMQEVILPDALETIFGSAFMGTNLKTLKMPDNVEKIHGQVFENCRNLKSVELNKKCEGLWDRCFAECINLENINLNSLEYIRNAAFLNCVSLKHVSLDAISSIYAGGFNGCRGLETAIIGDECTIIDSGAFCNCVNLKTVVLGKKVKNVGGLWGKIYGDLKPERDNPFKGCDNLKYLLYHGTPDEINMSVRNFFVNGCNLDIYYYSTEPKKGTWCYDKEKIVIW